MTLREFVRMALTASISLGALAVGMRVSLSDLSFVLTRPQRLIRALLAMNVLAPVVVVLVCKIFSLHPAMIVALVTLSIAPLGTLFSQSLLPLVALRSAAYVRGVFFASILVSVILTPLAVEVMGLVFGGSVHISPMTVAEVTIGSLVPPLIIGLAITLWWPASKQWVPLIQKVSSWTFKLSTLALMLIDWAQIGEVFRRGTLAAIALTTLTGLAIGHYLGGPDEDERTVLAFATVVRHPGLAVFVAGLTQQEEATVAVIFAVVVCRVVCVPYRRWRRRLRAKPAAATL